MNQNSSTNFEDQLIKGGAVFLGAISLILCVSLVMAVFTPFPLALAMVLYGRKKGLLVGLVGSVFAFVLGWKVIYGPIIFWTYILSWIFSLFIAEIILRKRDPLKGFLVFGWFLVVFLGGLIALRLSTMEGSFKGYLLKNTEVLTAEIRKDKSRFQDLKGEEAQELMEVLSKPEVMVEQVVDFMPKAFFIGVFFFFWVNLLLMLKVNHFYRYRLGYPYSEKDLLRLKVPDYMIWPVIVSLAVVILGAPQVSPMLVSLGKNALYGFGLFYFFQGFGIYVDFLDSLKIYGVFRSLLVVFTVVFGYWILIVIGLFDMWGNFRNFFKNKEN